MNLDGSEEPNRTGPDLFGFYLREITNLLSQDDELTSSSPRTGDTLNGAQESCTETDNSADRSLLFSGCLDAIPDGKRELLKVSMRQSVKSLTQEVDEMIDPVMRVRHLITYLRSKKQRADEEPLPKTNLSSPPSKKPKTSSSNGDDKEVDEYLKSLLEHGDTELLEGTITKHSNELEMTLIHMEQKLEELLDVVVSKCRPMTQKEKQELGKVIRNLPPKNLGRIAEITNTTKSSEISVDLEKQTNVTLWRLYFYVKAVENASKLSAS